MSLTVILVIDEGGDSRDRGDDCGRSLRAVPAMQPANETSKHGEEGRRH